MQDKPVQNHSPFHRQPGARGPVSRREFLWQSGGGLGGIALASLLGGGPRTAAHPSRARSPRRLRPRLWPRQLLPRHLQPQRVRLRGLTMALCSRRHPLPSLTPSRGDGSSQMPPSDASTHPLSLAPSLSWGYPDAGCRADCFKSFPPRAAQTARSLDAPFAHIVVMFSIA